MKVFLVDDNNTAEWFDAISQALKDKCLEVLRVTPRIVGSDTAFGNEAFKFICEKYGQENFSVVTDAAFSKENTGASGGNTLLHRLKKENAQFKYGVVYSGNPQCHRETNIIEQLVQGSPQNYALQGEIISHFFVTGQFRPLAKLQETILRYGAVLKWLDPLKNDLLSLSLGKVIQYGNPTPEAKNSWFGPLFESLGEGLPRLFSYEMEALLDGSEFKTVFPSISDEPDPKGDIFRYVLGLKQSMIIATKNETCDLLNQSNPGALRLLWDFVMSGGDVKIIKSDIEPYVLNCLSTETQNRYATTLKDYMQILIETVRNINTDNAIRILHSHALYDLDALKKAMHEVKSKGIF